MTLKVVVDLGLKQEQKGFLNNIKMRKYLLIAELFAYRSSDLQDSIKACVNEITNSYPESIRTLSSFEKHLNRLDLGKQEEYYSKTFDVSAQCSMDLGYVIFGEDYKRGEFLVKMKNEQRLAGHNFEIELADYLPNVLRLLYYHKNKDFVEELAYCITIPALKEILNKFKDTDNVYREVLVMLLNILEKDFGHSNREQINISKEKDNKVFQKACNVKC